jgi:hypothetical protein
VIRDEPSRTDTSSAEPSDDDRPDQQVFDRWRTDTLAVLWRAETARIDVYVRSMLPPAGAKESQTAVIERLKGLLEDSLVDDLTINVWGRRICLCDQCRGTETGRIMLGTVREFQSWGEEYDASVESTFEHRTQSSSITGAEYESITPPRVTTALYVDGDLRGVFPCVMGERHCTVVDLYETLAEAESGVRRDDLEPPT